MPHYEDSLVEVHKVVVGPMDNNVYVIRSKATGDAVLIDAANEHELLLEMCRDLGVRKVLETHGHWDHIQAVPAVRDAGYEVSVTAADAEMLPSYDLLLEDDTVIEVGDCGCGPSPRPGTRRGRCASRWRARRCSSAATRSSPAGPAPPSSRAATSPPSSGRSRTGCSRRFGPDTLVLPGHGDDTTIGAERPHLQEWVDRGW